MVKAKASAAKTPCLATVDVGSQIDKKSRTPTSFETRLYEVSKCRQAFDSAHIDQGPLPNFAFLPQPCSFSFP
jgi:hypothetical protein